MGQNFINVLKGRGLDADQGREEMAGTLAAPERRLMSLVHTLRQGAGCGAVRFTKQARTDRLELGNGPHIGVHHPLTGSLVWTDHHGSDPPAPPSSSCQKNGLLLTEQSEQIQSSIWQDGADNRRLFCRRNDDKCSGAGKASVGAKRFSAALEPGHHLDPPDFAAAPGPVVPEHAQLVWKWYGSSQVFRSLKIQFSQFRDPSSTTPCLP